MIICIKMKLFKNFIMKMEKMNFILGLIITYLHVVWSEFKLPTRDLKFDTLPTVNVLLPTSIKNGVKYIFLFSFMSLSAQNIKKHIIKQDQKVRVFKNLRPLWHEVKTEETILPCWSLNSSASLTSQLAFSLQDED